MLKVDAMWDAFLKVRPGSVGTRASGSAVSPKRYSVRDHKV